MSGATCIGQPLSWLALERYALAELDGATAADVRTHVAACAACRAALASIEGDSVALPPLPAHAADEPAARPGGQRVAVDELAARPGGQRVAVDELAARRRPRRGWVLGGGLVVAVAAAAVLLVWLRAPGGDGLPGRRVRVKGAGVVSLTLVRERDGAIAFDPPEVDAADRWKVQLTCDRAAPLWTDVVVYQRGTASFPLPAQSITCGNAVAVPGAFRITDGGATICVALADRAPDRARLARGDRAGALVCGAVVATGAR